MGWRPLAVAVAGLAVAITAELVTFLPEELGLAVGGALVGLTFLVSAWSPGSGARRAGLVC